MGLLFYPLTICFLTRVPPVKFEPKTMNLKPRDSCSSDCPIDISILYIQII